MKNTARNWKTTKVYRVAQDLMGYGDIVVDYGSGPYQQVKIVVESNGAQYLPHDPLWGYKIDGCRKNFADLVMGSNVLNVACKAPNPPKEYVKMLMEMWDMLKPEGHLVVNMPQSPRSSWMTPSLLREQLEGMFINVQQEGDLLIAWQKI